MLGEGTSLADKASLCLAKNMSLARPKGRISEATVWPSSCLVRDPTLGSGRREGAIGRGGGRGRGRGDLGDLPKPTVLPGVGSHAPKPQASPGVLLLTATSSPGHSGPGSGTWALGTGQECFLQVEDSGLQL